MTLRTKRDFPDLISKTWKAFKPQFAVNRFKKAGIVPFSRNAIDVKSLAPSHPFIGNPLEDLLVNQNDPSSESESDGDNGESITELLGNEIDDISPNIISIYSSPTLPNECLPSSIPTYNHRTIHSYHRHHTYLIKSSTTNFFYHQHIHQLLLPSRI